MRIAPKTRKEQPRRNQTNRLKYLRAKWANVRKMVLARDHHLCQACKRDGKLKQGNQIDHIIPAEKRPELFYVLDNLQTLCGSCHSAKTQKGS